MSSIPTKADIAALGRLQRWNDLGKRQCVEIEFPWRNIRGHYHETAVRLETGSDEHVGRGKTLAAATRAAYAKLKEALWSSSA